MTRLIIDAHLDLAWNAVSYNRDLTLAVEAIRRREQGMTDEPGRGKATISLMELRRASIRMCVGTLLARSSPERKPQPPVIKRTDLDYASPSIAYAAAHAQLAYYKALEKEGHVRIIRTLADFDNQWVLVQRDPETAPLGVVLSMEGCDPITTPAEAQEWWDLGLRAAGLAHYGRSHYAYGTGVDGPLEEAGVALLKEFDRLGMILDVTHLSDQSMAQALDLYKGRVWASHHNCRALVPGDRQLTDEQIKRLVGRGAIIGAALDAWMLYPNWERGKTEPKVVGIEAVADHIDHVCQLAGNANHSAIGSDLDGGYGTEQTPRDVSTIADLQKLGNILIKRKYKPADVDAIFYRNALGFLREALPKT